MIDDIPAQIREVVLRTIAEKAALHPDEIGMECNIFEEAWVDSLGMFRLVLDLEKNLNIKLPSSLVTDERMHKVEGIMRCLVEAMSAP